MTSIDEKYQTFWSRFWASWVDFFLWLPLLLVGFWIDENILSPLLLALWLIFYSMAYSIYSVFMHAKFGQTLGKMALGLKVLAVSESKLTLRQALLRDSVFIAFSLISVIADMPRTLSGISRNSEEEFGLLEQFDIYGITLWTVILMVSVIANPKRRGLHDYMANSVVVLTKFKK
jgi:uncharacterized RDD family membrane protein YckC